MLSVMDIHNKEFKKGFRGYNEAEVDEFLDAVVKDYEALYRENLELKETVERVSSKLEYYQNLESTIQSTLLIAQEAASEIKVNAKKEIELKVQETENTTQKMVDEATTKSKKMIEDAESKVRQILDEADDKVKKASLALYDLQRDTQFFKSKLKNMLNSQLEVIENKNQDT